MGHKKKYLTETLKRCLWSCAHQKIYAESRTVGEQKADQGEHSTFWSEHGGVMTVPTYEVTAHLLVVVSTIVPTVSKDPFMRYIAPVYDPLDDYLNPKVCQPVIIFLASLLVPRDLWIPSIRVSQTPYQSPSNSDLPEGAWNTLLIGHRTTTTAQTDLPTTWQMTLLAKTESNENSVFCHISWRGIQQAWPAGVHQLHVCLEPPLLTPTCTKQWQAARCVWTAAPPQFPSSEGLTPPAAPAPPVTLHIPGPEAWTVQCAQPRCLSWFAILAGFMGVC